MTCQQHNCGNEATHTVFWPGQTTLQCDEHTKMLQNLAGVMGFELTVGVITAWSSASPEEKTAALSKATELLDANIQWEKDKP